MSVLEQTDATVKVGVLLVAGLITGGLAAYFIDGIPRLAIPAVGLVVFAVIAYLEGRN